jgi:hypothetical protein
MSIVKQLGQVAVAAVLAIGLMGPGSAEARSARIAEDVVAVEPAGGIIFGPSPPLYPYYHFGQYGVPVGWHVPFAGPGVYGCHHEEVWTGRRWRRVRVCD